MRNLLLEFWKSVLVTSIVDIQQRQMQMEEEEDYEDEPEAETPA